MPRSNVKQTGVERAMRRRPRSPHQKRARPFVMAAAREEGLISAEGERLADDLLERLGAKREEGKSIALTVIETLFGRRKTNE